MKKRIAIFFFFDEAGKVDRYIPYFLDSLRQVSQYILVVCNGTVTPEGRKIFEEHSDEFFCRENKGLDTEAFKEAILYLGWDRLGEYDELIMTNFTIFGPIYPLEEMFSEMETRDVDYWGLLKRFEDPGITSLAGRAIPYSHIMDYTLSNFRVIGSDMLHSLEFRRFWEDLPVIADYMDSSLYGEIYFEKYFSDCGFSWDSYMSDDTRDACSSPNVNECWRLIVNERLPFIRKRAWISPYSEIFDFGYGEEPRKTLEYIDKNTDYDVSMIYENLIRTTPMNILKDRLQLNFIADERNSFLDGSAKRRIAVICHLFYEECLDEMGRYFSGFPKDTDFYITVSDEQMLKTVKEKLKTKAEITLIPNRERDVSAHLIPYRDKVLYGGYDYICFLHDKLSKHQGRKSGESFANRCFSAVCGNRNVVENIINIFEKNRYIGFISPAPPYHGNIFYIVGGSWTKNFENVKKLAEKFDVDVKLIEKESPVGAYGTLFWARPEAVRKLFAYNWTYEDFPEEPTGVNDGLILHAIELFYPVIAQDAGYLSAYVLNDSQSRSEITNLTFVSKELALISRGYNFNKIKNDKSLHSKSLSSITANNSSVSCQLIPQTARIYFDYGEGYSEATAMDGGFVDAKESYVHEFKLIKKAKRIRFDPANSTACLVRNAYASADGKECSMSALNGFTINGISYLMNMDPQMNINVGSPVEGVLTVNADIVPLYDDIFYSIFEQYNEDHKKLKKLEDKLLGKNIPETVQIKYDPDEYGFDNMQDNTGKQILYIDTGSGYSEATARKTDGNKIGRSRLFEEEYSFKKVEPVRLRFDPANKCGCIVYGMEVVSNLGKLKYRCLNGFELYGTYVFFTNDSQFEIIVPSGGKVTRLKIKAFIVPVSDGLVFQALADCRVTMERYNRLKNY